MNKILLPAFLLLATLQVPSVAAMDTATVFPPENCNRSEMRVIAWQDGSRSTVCATSQDIFRLGLPTCREGQRLVYHEAEYLGRNPVGMKINGQPPTGEFLCESEPDPVYFRVSTNRQDAAYDVPTTAKFDSVYYDKGAGFDTVRGIYVAPVDGLYSLSVVAGWHNIRAGKFAQAGIESDSGQVCYQSTVGTDGHVYESCSATIYLRKGQAVWPVIYQADVPSTWASVVLTGAKIAD